MWHDATTRDPLKGFSWNSIWGHPVTVCQYIKTLVKIGQKYRTLYIETYPGFYTHLGRKSLKCYRSRKCYVHKVAEKNEARKPRNASIRTVWVPSEIRTEHHTEANTAWATNYWVFRNTCVLPSLVDRPAKYPLPFRIAELPNFDIH
jgi:hypothetical protein